MHFKAISEGDLDEIVESACSVLKTGGVIVYPTDTLYGLGVDPFNPKALKMLISLKGREAEKAISICVADVSEVSLYGVVDEGVLRLIDEFLPGPLTLVLPKKDERLPWDTIGIRIPDNHVALAIFKAFGPVTSTSANISGQEASGDIREIASIFKEDVRLYIQGELPLRGKASTVVECIDGRIRILREGVISKDRIMQVWEE
jgi:L-threonylcarbamoyladenylate synthase